MAGKPEKAYKNLKFLNSADARVIRILAEYLEPRARFRRLKVKDTIVFFGSARLEDRETALKRLEDCREIYKEDPSPETEFEVRRAEKRLEMSKYYEDARILSGMLTDWSLHLTNTHRRFLVTSGGGPGIMEAANRGAFEVPGGRSIGLNISIPTEQHSNPYITEELNFEFHYFFTRKFWFVYLAKALVVFPGGFGTLDELFEVMTLIQTHKLQKQLPIVLYGQEYWKNLINFDFLVENHMINEEDLELFRYADAPEEAFEYLRDELSKML